MNFIRILIQEDEKENPAEQMTKDETVSQSDEEEKKYPTMYYRFNPVVKVLEFHKGGIPQNVTKVSNSNLSDTFQGLRSCV